MISDALAQAAVDLAIAQQDAAALDRIAALLDADDNDLPTLADAAADYAAQGIAVFPLIPGEKRPATRNGFKDATTDPGLVAAWWADNPAYNIGFPTGRLWDVIDVDGPIGYLSMHELEDAGKIPPLLAKVATSRGGRHLYIPPTGDGNAAGVLAGIDYRGVGGYVVAPPSVSAATARRWRWMTPLARP